MVVFQFLLEGMAFSGLVRAHFCSCHKSRLHTHSPSVPFSSRFPHKYFPLSTIFRVAGPKILTYRWTLLSNTFLVSTFMEDSLSPGSSVTGGPFEASISRVFLNLLYESPLNTYDPQTRQVLDPQGVCIRYLSCCGLWLTVTATLE